MTSRLDDAFAAITARAAKAAGETPRRRRQPRASTPDTASPFARLHDGAIRTGVPCSEDGCDDDATVYVLLGSGTSEALCPRGLARARYRALTSGRRPLVEIIPPLP